MHRNDIFSKFSRFADFLNTNGFSITPDQVSRLLVMSDEAGIEITNDASALILIKTVFCKSPGQYASIEQLFRQFIEKQTRKQKIKQLKKKAKDLQNEFDKYQNIVFDVANKRDVAQTQAEQEIQQEMGNVESLYTDSEKKTIRKLKDLITSCKSKALEDCLYQSITSDKDTLKLLEQLLLTKAKQAYVNKQTTLVSQYAELAKLLHKAVTQKASGPMPEVKRRISERVKEYIADDINREKEAEKAMKSLRQQQRRLDAELQSLSAQTQMKDIPVTHRDLFIGRHATQSLYDAPDFALKKFKTLTDKEKQEIKRYILRNINNLKTRMTRNITTQDKNLIDMQTTIQYACKTGGIPIDLYFHHKRPSKAKLVMILDISGSCSEASEMMLTFMYYLQSVFPRGCQAYAFVNELYNISTLMQTRNPDEAIAKAFSLIPTKGVYSNYAKPLTSLWEEHRKEIDKETIVIFMGDARNNKNPAAEFQMKNICRRAKKAFWLNTETADKWNQQDSIAGIYGRYAKMYETTTIKDILWFINEGLG